MGTLNATIEHDGTTYRAVTCVIERTRMGWEDHGCFQAGLAVHWDGGGTTIAGMILDDVPADKYDIKSQRRPTLFGMAMIQGLIRTLAGDYGHWEDLVGMRIFGLWDLHVEQNHGFQCKGVATADGTRVLIFDEVARKWGVNPTITN